MNRAKLYLKLEHKHTSHIVVVYPEFMEILIKIRRAYDYRELINKLIETHPICTPPLACVPKI